MAHWPRPVRLVATLLLAAAGALLWQAAHAPLPWMIGPLLAVGGLRAAGVGVLGSGRLRNLGQGLIGVALGLYFTPQVVGLLLPLAPAIAIGVAWAFALGDAFYRLLRRFNTVDPTTAFYAAAIGGASEMAVLAERAGGRVDRVAAAHSMRVLVIVLTIPLAYQALGVHGSDATLPAVAEFRPGGLALLLGAAALGMALFHRLGVPNPWVLGALAVTAGLTASGVGLSALPKPASNGAQLLIGVALGSRFTPDFVRTAPRWLATVALGTWAMIAATGLLALGLAWATGLHPATALLALSPGGIAEMAITAKVLQLGVPTVTAFQVIRYVAVLTLTGPLHRRELRRLGVEPPPP